MGSSEATSRSLSHDGSSQGFGDFYLEHRPQMVRLAFLLTQDRGHAEDLVQEVFGRVHGRFSSLDDPAAYLRVAVVNACRAEFRRRDRERDSLRRLVPLTVEGHAEVRELLDAVAQLPYRQRAVIVLRYYGDMSERDIALALRCRPGTVKSLAARALAALSREIDR